MVLYNFLRPIPVDELEAELRAFARDVSREGLDTVTGLHISFEPFRAGAPFELMRPDSDGPISRITFESRLARRKLKAPSNKTAA